MEQHSSQAKSYLTPVFVGEALLVTVMSINDQGSYPPIDEDDLSGQRSFKSNNLKYLQSDSRQRKTATSIM